MILLDLIGIRTLESVTVLRGARQLLPVVHISLDGTLLRFNRRTADSGESWLSAITVLHDPTPHAATHRFEPPRVVEIRWRCHSPNHADDDVVYAIDQESGLVIFELGTQWEHAFEEVSFVWECDPAGYTPGWLVPIDPDPPLEIAPKAKHAGDRVRKRTPTGHRAYPRST